MSAAGEVVGLDQSIAYAHHLTAQAGQHGPDGNEGYLARLAACRVTGDGLTSGRAMQDAFAAAATAAAAHASELTRQKNIQEQYDVNPDAGNKPYLTGADVTGPAPATDTAAGTGAVADEAAVRSARDMLARGAHIGFWSLPGWRRGAAREWDAGRAGPEQRAAAYAAADEILAARAAIAAGPGAARMQAMRDNGIVRCPSWCQQHPDEDDDETHVGPGHTFTSDNGGTVTVRPQVSWWPDIAPTVALAVTPAQDGTGTLALTADELGRLHRLSSDVLSEAAQQHDDPALATGKPAYPGAYAETADADHAVTDPAAAAAALDQQARASGYYLTEDDDSGPYLDWSSQPEAGVRTFEVGDGTATVAFSMTTYDLQQLRDDIGQAIGAVDDGVQDPGRLLLDDEDEDDDDVYVAWSVVEDGGRFVECSDGDDTVQLELTNAQLRELHARLTLQLQLDAQDDLR